MNAIKLAGFGAALLVFVAVAIGFRGEELGGLTDTLSRFAALGTPALFGLTPFEWIVIAIAALMGAIYALRWALRRFRR